MKTILKSLRAAGYQIELDGDSIVWQWAGVGQPDADKISYLLAQLKNQKTEAVTILRKEVREGQHEAFEERAAFLAEDLPESSLGHVNVFDPEHHPSPGVPVVLDDLDQPGRYVARYAGNLELAGYGATQIEALAGLKRQTDAKTWADGMSSQEPNSNSQIMKGI